MLEILKSLELLNIADVGGLVLTVLLSGGSGPFTYKWFIKTSQKNGPIITGGGKTVVTPQISGVDNTPVVLIDDSVIGENEIAIGTVGCKVTDANGNSNIGYYEVQINPTPA